MATIPTIGPAVTAPPTEANRPAPNARARTTASTEGIDPAAAPRFVDRRRNRERRRLSKKPLLDTRRNKDRRRTGRLEIEI
ncbi:MAG: hypothetical protein WBN40_13245 [Pseudomonadales bacterium]